MFEKDLYTEIVNNFVNTLLEDWQDVTVYFGDAPEETQAPYIVMYPLNNDGTRQVLCDIDDYTDGAASIQFSIYDVDYSNACYLGRQLDIFLAQLRLLPNYRILLNNSEVIRGFPDVNTGISIETVTRSFTYTNMNIISLPLSVQSGLLVVNDNDLLTVQRT